MSRFYRASSFNEIEEGIQIVYEKMTIHEQKGQYQ